MKIDKLNPTSWIIHGLTLLVPLLVLPGVVDNAFEAPKGALILSGVLLLVAIHGFNYFRGKGVLCSRAATSQVVLLLLLLNALNLLYTENLYYSRVAVVMNVGSLCFFYFVSLSIASRGAQRVFAVIACSGLVVAILVLLQSAGHFVFFKPIDPAGQVAGTIGNANSLGAYLIFPVTVLAGAAFFWPPKWRGVASIFLVVTVAGLIVSRARASWIGCGVAGAVLTLLLVRINRFSFRRFFLQSPRRALFYGIALIVLCGSAWSLVPERWQSNLSVASLTDQTSLNFRKKFWQASWHLWLDRNPLLGSGLGSFRNLVYDAQSEINAKDQGFFENYTNPKPRRVHNEYLETLNDGGLVSAAALLLFVGLVLRHGYRVIGDANLGRETRIVAAVCFAAVAGIMTTALFFFPFRISVTLFMTSLMLGILEGLYLRSYGLLARHASRFPLPARWMAPIVGLTCIVIFWQAGYRPLKGEWAHKQFNAALTRGDIDQAERYLMRAILLDPDNTVYHFDAGRFYMESIGDLTRADRFLDQALAGFNGDVARWGVYFVRGLVKCKLGNLLAARDAFTQAVYFNPSFDPARRELERMDRLFRGHENYHRPRKMPG